MRKQHLLLWAAIWLMAAAFGGCETRCSTANIRSAVMTKDKEGTQPTTVYAPGDDFWCIVQLANAPDDTEFKAVLVAVQTTSGNNISITEFQKTLGSAVLPIQFTLPNAWPTGKYKVDLYIDGKLVKSVPFEVQEGGGEGG